MKKLFNFFKTPFMVIIGFLLAVIYTFALILSLIVSSFTIKQGGENENI